MAIEIYKRNQGSNTRLWSAIGAAVVVGLGCYQLYNKLSGMQFGMSARAQMWLVTMVPAGLFVLLGLLIFWLSNRHSIADFLISAEGEMKKVNWSSRKEVAASTAIVIFVVIGMAILLGVTDLVFQLFFVEVLKL